MGVHNNPQTLICRPDMQVSTYTISPQEFIRSELEKIQAKAEMEQKKIQTKEEESQETVKLDLYQKFKEEKIENLFKKVLKETDQRIKILDLPNLKLKLFKQIFKQATNEYTKYYAANPSESIQGFQQYHRNSKFYQ